MTFHTTREIMAALHGAKPAWYFCHWYGPANKRVLGVGGKHEPFFFYEYTEMRCSLRGTLFFPSCHFCFLFVTGVDRLGLVCFYTLLPSTSRRRGVTIHTPTEYQDFWRPYQNRCSETMCPVIAYACPKKSTRCLIPCVFNTHRKLSSLHLTNHDLTVSTFTASAPCTLSVANSTPSPFFPVAASPGSTPSAIS